MSSSASSIRHTAVAYAAVPATIMESEVSQTLDYSKMSHDVVEQLISESSSSVASDDEHMSDDEETIIKAQLKILKAKKVAADMKAQELELKFRLKQKQRSNAGQSSHGSNDRSRTRLYPTREAANTSNYDVFTPPQMDMTYGEATTSAIPPLPF